MARLIRDPLTKQYLQNGQWTDEPSLARHFSTPDAALIYCIANDIRSVDLVLQLGSAPDDIPDVSIHLP